MKHLVLTTLLLAATASCSTPRLPDPRFEFPDAPAPLLEPTNGLEPITSNDVQSTNQVAPE